MARPLGQTTDGGESWHTLIAGSLTHDSIGALAIDPAMPRTLYAGGGHGVFKSTDSGESWQATGLGYVLALAIDPTTPSTLYAATESGVFKSTNGGRSSAAALRHSACSTSNKAAEDQSEFLSLRLNAER